MSYATYMMADAFPGKTGEREMHPHSNVNSYDYGQTMRYAAQEVTAKREEIIANREKNVDNTYTFSLPQMRIQPSVATYPMSLASDDDGGIEEWQPWMQRPGIYLAQSRISDIEETMADKMSENARYGVPDEYVTAPNEVQVYSSNRIDQEIGFEAYTS